MPGKLSNDLKIKGPFVITKKKRIRWTETTKEFEGVKRNRGVEEYGKRRETRDT